MTALMLSLAAAGVACSLLLSAAAWLLVGFARTLLARHQASQELRRIVRSAQLARRAGPSGVAR